MKTNTAQKEQCQRCGEMLDPEKVVWLELDTYEGTYHPAGVVKPEDSQGFFAFGRACAKHPNTKPRGQ